MRFNRSFVSGFLATSGDFGPPSPPCFGSHGAGAGGFCVLSGILNITDLRARTQLARRQKGFLRVRLRGGKRILRPRWNHKIAIVRPVTAHARQRKTAKVALEDQSAMADESGGFRPRQLRRWAMTARSSPDFSNYPCYSDGLFPSAAGDAAGAVEGLADWLPGILMVCPACSFFASPILLSC
jgi:hypothetical protein